MDRGSLLLPESPSPTKYELDLSTLLLHIHEGLLILPEGGVRLSRSYVHHCSISSLMADPPCLAYEEQTVTVSLLQPHMSTDQCTACETCKLRKLRCMS
jgi:hypothetical protein